MMASRDSHVQIRMPRNQRGAVLYVALIMLVLLALLGIVGMRVAGLQERMSASYRDVNVAFQQAELKVRDVEENISQVLGGNNEFVADSQNCLDGYDPTSWATSSTTEVKDDQHTKRIDKCFPQSDISEGAGPANEDTGNIYQVTGIRSSGRGTAAAIDTVFIPQ